MLGVLGVIASKAHSDHQPGAVLRLTKLDVGLRRYASLWQMVFRKAYECATEPTEHFWRLDCVYLAKYRLKDRGFSYSK